ncbi:hypothetical protein ACFC4S_22060 [Priestia megaterium]|uniref:hypothetical protein n=1 Tax=Priestia megaterium TaxID=1404 RepID=UPI0035E0BE4D
MKFNKIGKRFLITAAAGILITTEAFLIYPKAHHTYQMMFTELGYWNDYNDIYGLKIPKPDKINNIFDELGPFGEGLTYTAIGYSDEKFKSVKKEIKWHTIDKKLQNDVKEFTRVANQFLDVKKDDVLKKHPVPLANNMKNKVLKSNDGHITVLMNSEQKKLYILEMAAD